MYPNINAGLGKLMAETLINNQVAIGATGRFFIVCASTNANTAEVNGMFGGSYADGTPVVYTSIVLASAKCVAGRGDVILVAPGHTESISSATALTMSISNVSVIGLGVGAARPVVTLDTAATATLNVSAAGVTFKNIVFVANFADVASCFTLTTAKDFAVLNCEFRDTSAIFNFLCIVTTSATNNQADGLTFNGNYVYSLPTTDGAVVSVLANLLRLQVCDNIVDKAATNDAGHMITSSSKILGGVRILRNILTVVGVSSGAAAVFFTGTGATSSGVLGFNNVMSLDTTGGIIMSASTGIRPMQNYLSGAVDQSGTLNPTADDPA